MNWLLKLFSRSDREFRGKDYSARFEPVMREIVSVVHTRGGASVNFYGERIGAKWEGIHVLIPQEVAPAQLRQIVEDLKTAFAAMRCGYVIDRKAGVDIVPEAERQAAIAELREMGYEIEVLADGKIRQTHRAGALRPDMETIRVATPRMTALLQTVHGARQRFEILAKSKEF